MSDATSFQAKLPAQVVPPVSPHAASALALQIGVVIVAALCLAKEVLIPVTLAILPSFILAPLVALLRRVHLGRVPAVLLAVVVALGVIGGLGSVSKAVNFCVEAAHRAAEAGGLETAPPRAA